MTKVFKLPVNSIGIPKLGIGSGTSYKKKDSTVLNEKLVSILTTGVDEGFIHLDSAEAYGNDDELKETLYRVLNEGKLKREDIFITDKYFSGIGTTDRISKHDNPYDRLKYILEYLNTPYIDLYLLHSPFIKKESHGFDLKGAWKFMQQALDEGLTKRIGISNFAIEDIEEIWNSTKTNPQVNQIEFNAFLQNQTPGIFEYTQSKGIVIQAYSPLSPLTRGELNDGIGLEFDELLNKLSKKYNKTKTQILLRWTLDLDVIPITTTSKPERFQEFKGIFDWSLSPEEVAAIKTIGSKYEKPIRKCWLKKYGHYDN